MVRRHFGKPFFIRSKILKTNYNTSQTATEYSGDTCSPDRATGQNSSSANGFQPVLPIQLAPPPHSATNGNAHETEHGHKGHDRGGEPNHPPAGAVKYHGHDTDSGAVTSSLPGTGPNSSGPSQVTTGVVDNCGTTTTTTTGAAGGTEPGPVTNNGSGSTPVPGQPTTGSVDDCGTTTTTTVGAAGGTNPISGTSTGSGSGMDNTAPGQAAGGTVDDCGATTTTGVPGGSAGQGGVPVTGITTIPFTPIPAPGSDPTSDPVATGGGTTPTPGADPLPVGQPVIVTGDPIPLSDTTAPAVTATLGPDGLTITGGGDPNTAVTIADGGTVVGTTQSDASGAWSYDAATLDTGTHALVASETDPAGNTGSAPPLAVTIADPRFSVVNSTTADSVLLHGSDYAGPVNFLQAAYGFSGTDSSVTSALVGNVFINAGAGENAAAAKDGTNVLAGSAGSSWLVGASGSDGGVDTFFLNPQGNQATWDTLMNFHVGDMLTLWDFSPTAGSMHSVGLQGAGGAKGETLSLDFGQGSGPDSLVTFAGLSSDAQFASASGTTGGHDFTMLTRTA